MIEGPRPRGQLIRRFGLAVESRKAERTVITPGVRALVRKRDDGLYYLEAYDRPGVPHSTTLHHSLVAALNSERRYVHLWRPVSSADQRAGIFDRDVLYVVLESLRGVWSGRRIAAHLCP